MRVAIPVDAGVLHSVEMSVGSADVEGDVVDAYIGIEPLCMFSDTPSGWPSISAQVAGGSTFHWSLMVSE